MTSNWCFGIGFLRFFTIITDSNGTQTLFVCPFARSLFEIISLLSANLSNFYWLIIACISAFYRRKDIKVNCVKSAHN